MSIAQDELLGYDRPANPAAERSCDDVLTWPMRRLVLARDDYGCVCCNRSVLSRPYGIQLRKPRNMGGVISPENLITVLAECGERISFRRNPADEDRGYVVRPWDEPSLVPVAYTTPAGQAKWWLLPDGRRSFEPPAGARGDRQDSISCKNGRS